MKKKINQIEREVTEFIREIVVSVQKIERATPIEERITNMNKNFSFLFNQARDNGAIRKDIIDDLNLQVQKHTEALQRSLNNTNLREEVKDTLINELVESYYYNIHGIYMETIPENELQ